MGAAPARRHVSTTVDRDVEVVMSDGTVLAMDVHRPDNDLPVGCLLQRVPYGKDVPGILAGALDPTRALERGYAVAVQDCRGRGRSDGEFVPFVHEADDGADTVRWIASQSWCDGNVGMFGRSYAAMCQWLVAGSEALPELRAVAPMFSGASPWRDWLLPDGVGEWGFTLLWCLRYLTPETVARQVRSGRAGELADVDLATWIADIDRLFRHGSGVADDRVDRLMLEAPLVGHVLDAERRGDGGATCTTVQRSPITRVPTMVIGGWFDVFLRGTLDTWSLVNASADPPPTQLVVGPWAHGGTCPGTFPEQDFGSGAGADAMGLTGMQLDWFDRWMGDCADGAEHPPPARVFVTGANVWRDEAAWPPADVTDTRWYLTPGHDAASIDGVLRSSRTDATGNWELGWDEATPVPTVGGQTFLPGLDVAANAGPRDQYALLGRGDVLAFVGEESLGTNAEIAGAPVVSLAVSGAPTGTRWCVRLVDVGADGWMLLAEAAALSTEDDAPVVVRLPDVSHSMHPGHRLGIVISHTSFPRYGGWVTGPHPAPPRRGSSRLHHGPAAPTWLDVPVRHHRKDVT